MKTYSSREVIKKLEKNGWYLVRIKGDHHQYTNGHMMTTITHPIKDMPIGTLKAIGKQTGIKFD
jgi:predicted RNA binding protein YcfA (HicA-like mRNA interferase family)